MKLFLLNVSLCILLVAGVGGDDPRKFKPYEVLGVQRSSSTQEIKKAFKRLVKELHPDKNKAPDANDRLEFLHFITVVGDNINIMKTTLLCTILLLTSFFRITSLQVIKEKLFKLTASLCFHFLCIHAV